MKNLLLAGLFVLVFTDCHKARGYNVVDTATGITDAPKDIGQRSTRRIDSFYGVDFRTMDVFNPKNCKKVEKRKGEPDHASIYFRLNLKDCTVSLKNDVHAFYLNDERVPELKDRLIQITVNPDISDPKDIPDFYRFFSQKYGDSVPVDPDQETATYYRCADVLESCKGDKQVCGESYWIVHTDDPSLSINFTFLDRYGIVAQARSQERKEKARRSVE
jgi:hypothetical protein